jgi:hypothetical protein
MTSLHGSIDILNITALLACGVATPAAGDAFWISHRGQNRVAPAKIAALQSSRSKDPR